MRYGLKFISGKYQGGEYPLPEDGELLIGRASELDLVLAEDMVSRKHAKLTVQGGALGIADLGSTNGTFVNGEKVKRADLKRGDRILVGTSILKVVEVTELASASGDSEQAKSMMQELGARQSSSTMSGELTEVPLPDLLQLLATNKKGGALTISGPESGAIYIKQGQVLYASINGEPELKAFKAFCRMAAWERGAFTLDPVDESAQFPETFQESTESLLIEALRQVDEMRRIAPSLPKPDVKLRMKAPLAARLSALTDSELDTLQLALNGATVKQVIDKTPASDHEAMVNLHKLVKEGYVEAG